MLTVKALKLSTRIQRALKTQPHSARANCQLTIIILWYAYGVWLWL